MQIHLVKPQKDVWIDFCDKINLIDKYNDTELFCKLTWYHILIITDAIENQIVHLNWVGAKSLLGIEILCQVL